MQYYKAIFDNVAEGKALVNKEKKLFFVYFMDHTTRQISLVGSEGTYSDLTEEEFNDLELYVILREFNCMLKEEPIIMLEDKELLYDGIMNFMSCAKSCQVANI